MSILLQPCCHNLSAQNTSHGAESFLRSCNTNAQDSQPPFCSTLDGRGNEAQPGCYLNMVEIIFLTEHEQDTKLQPNCPWHLRQ